MGWAAVGVVGISSIVLLPMGVFAPGPPPLPVPPTGKLLSVSLIRLRPLCVSDTGFLRSLFYQTCFWHNLAAIATISLSLG
jgi:hypothetical protein